MIATGGLAAVVGGVSIAFLPRSALIAGAVLVAYQVVYFAGLKLSFPGFGKRWMAAVGWAAGIAVPAWSAGGHLSEIVLGTAILVTLGWINLQSYSMVDDACESNGSTQPGTAWRAVAIGLATSLLLVAFWWHPEQDARWLAVLLVAVVQVVLIRVPLDLVHPVGEWSLALLGLVALV